MVNITQKVDPIKLDISIEQLKQYANDAGIESLVSVLETLRNDPDNESLLRVLTDTFARLGIAQGAVLTYAPYVRYLLLDDIFGDTQ